MIHKAKKSLGQNFLKSQLALNKIVEAGEIKSDDVILEIGPGKGALTRKLLEKAGLVIAVEKDYELFGFLKMKFEKEIAENPPSHKATDGQGKLILLNDDILEFEVTNYKLQKYKIIANIPYNITGAILKKFLTDKYQPSLMVLMVQHEVAKRIMASDKKESILSISVKAYGEPKMIIKVPARYFSPSPKVDSAVILIKNISRENFLPPLLNKEGNEGRFLINSPHPDPLLVKERGEFETKFWEIVKAGFAHKRKKLSSNLKTLKCQSKALAELGNKRAEDLTLEDWLALTK